MTAAWVAAAMEGTIAGDPERVFGNVSIDTRTIAPGDLFIAIRGERFDGTEFTAQAIEKGAAGVVVPRSFDVAQPFRAANAGLKPCATVVKPDLSVPQTEAREQRHARAGL